MKKTLILTLSLLAAVAAQAATVSFESSATLNENGYLSNGNKTFSWENGGSLEDYTLTFTVLDNGFANNSNYTVLTMGGSNDNILSVSAKVSSAGEKTLTLTHGNGSTFGGQITHVPSLEFTSGESYTLAVVGDYAYLWKAADAPTQTTLASWLDMTGPQDTAYLQISTSYVANGYELTSGTARAWANQGKSPIKILDVSVVPEPATATLSLLALAGLAARRRRK